MPRELIGSARITPQIGPAPRRYDLVPMDERQPVQALGLGLLSDVVVHHEVGLSGRV